MCRRASWVLVAPLVVTLFASIASGESTRWETLMGAAAEAFEQARYPEAERRLQAALKEAEKFGPNDLRLGITLNNLAVVYFYQDKDAEAEPLYLRAIAIYEKTVGPDHPELARSLDNLAALYHFQRKNGEAAEMKKRAEAIRAKHNRKEEADKLGNNGIKSVQEGRIEEGLALLRQATEVSPDDPLWHMKFGSILFKIGEVIFKAGLLKEGNMIFREAEKELLLAIKFFRETDAEEKLFIGHSYFLLGDAYYYVFEDKDKAKTHYRNALKHYPEHPGAAEAMKRFPLSTPSGGDLA